MSAIDKAAPTSSLKLNHFYELMCSEANDGNIEEALKIGKKVFDDAIADLDKINDSDYQTTVIIMQKIRDKLSELSDNI